MKNKVPDGWEAYKAMGRQIPGTRFICFKVPLKEEIMQNAVNKGAEWFCPRTLMDHCHNLGLIVDLTYTDKYYDPMVFTSQGIRYDKILTQGKVVPKPKVIREFFKIVNSFLEENKENEKLIGVHCTHGLNRSGYLVCRYMIEHLGIAPDQAISDFNSARGHEQERKEYLDHLRQMKWQQEPAVASDSEEGEQGKTPNPNTNRRRSKRNLDALRGGWREAQRPNVFSNQRGGGWREAQRLPEINISDQYRPRAQPRGPVALGGGAQGGRSNGGVYQSGSFRGVYDSGALATKMTTMNLGPQDQPENGPEPLTRSENTTDQITDIKAEVPTPPHPRATTGEGQWRHRGTRSRPPRTEGNATTTLTTQEGWRRSTTQTFTSNRGQEWAPPGSRQGGRGTSIGRAAAMEDQGNTRDRDNMIHPHRGRGRPWNRGQDSTRRPRRGQGRPWNRGQNSTRHPRRGEGRPWTSHTKTTPPRYPVTAFQEGMAPGETHSAQELPTTFSVLERQEMTGSDSVRIVNNAD